MPYAAAISTVAQPLPQGAQAIVLLCLGGAVALAFALIFTAGEWVTHRERARWRRERRPIP